MNKAPNARIQDRSRRTRKGKMRIYGGAAAFTIATLIAEAIHPDHRDLANAVGAAGFATGMLLWGLVIRDVYQMSRRKT